MDDKSTTLAFSLHHSPGAYAVLLGSGVSRSAGIMTGQEVVVNLCHRLALANGAEDVSEPLQWYRDTYQVPARYDDLIQKLAPEKPEQRALLREYFEPTDDDLQAGRKVPTKAHRAIAELCKKGVVKLILTTNFDGLMEEALRQQNVQFELAYDSNMLAGLTSLTHAGCTLVKLHGDYRSATMRNVAGDLEEYDDELNQFLDRAFDDFGSSQFAMG